MVDGVYQTARFNYKGGVIFDVSHLSTRVIIFDYVGKKRDGQYGGRLDGTRV